MVLILELSIIDLFVVLPYLAKFFDPGGIHGLDIGAFTSDMAIFGCVVVTNNKMGYVGCEIVFMNTTKLGNFGSDAGLGIMGQ